ncbi:MAG: alpha-amylase [Lachnospiraceae bacterium]|nr:alpha-amylase [Lachnospiraceae bacterium]
MYTNKTMMQFFEWYLKPDSTHWNRVIKEAVNIKEAGITSVWLPPAYKGAGGVKDVGYAVYDLYDLGEFNQKGTIPTKYGTKDEYLEAIKELKKQGIEVLGDIVLGHKMGADEQERIFAYGNDEYDRNRQISGKQKVRVWTKFTFPGRNNKYSDFKWDWTNFHATDFNAENHETGVYKFIGKEWDEDVDYEFGNYDYLMGVDLDMSDPEVVEELDKWGEWYYDFTGIDGFRIDAVKHIDFNFFREWLNKLREKKEKDIFAVGEYWNAELNILENYINKTERALSLFDVPLHFHFYHASRSNGYYDMRYILKHTLVGTDPELAVTFVDNHDTQPGQSLESWVLEWFKIHAYSLILLRNDGIPCIFYGDYYGIPHDKIKPVKNLDKLLKVRQNKNYGVLHDYFNDCSIIGWSREGVDEIADSGLVVIMTISEGGNKRMYAGKHFAGLTFVDVLGNVDEEIIIDENGFGVFEVADGSTSVYVLKEGQTVPKRSEEIFKDEVEFGALEDIPDGVEPELFFGSNYTNKRIYEPENIEEIFENNVTEASGQSEQN